MCTHPLSLNILYFVILKTQLLISRVKCHWIQSLCCQESPKCWESSIGVQNIYILFFLLSSLWILYECLDLRMRCGQHLGGGDGCVQVFHGAAVCLQHVPVEWGCNKSWVGIPMHKGINLKLCFVESLLGWRHHILIYNLSHPAVEAHLSRRQDGYVVFIYHPCFLLHLLWTGLLLQVLAGHPKENVLLTIFTTQELSKHPTPA